MSHVVKPLWKKDEYYPRVPISGPSTNPRTQALAARLSSGTPPVPMTTFYPCRLEADHQMPRSPLGGERLREDANLRLGGPRKPHPG